MGGQSPLDMVFDDGMFRAVVESSPLPTMLLRDGRVAYANPAWRALLGLTSPLEEWVDTAIEDFVAPEHIERVKARLQRVNAGHANPGEQIEIVRGDGSRVWFEGKSVPIAFGGHRATLVIGQDITERKRLEQKAYELDTWQRQLGSSGLIAYWAVDLVSRRANYSPEWKRRLGYEEHEIGDSLDEWRSRLHPDDAQKTTHEWTKLLERGPSSHVEYRLRHREGHYIWVFSVGTRVCDAVGKPVRVIGAHVDVTAQREAERALRSSEQRNRLLFENAGLGIGYYDLDGTCLQMNRIGCRNMQLEPAEIVGRNVLDLFGDLGAKALERIRSAAKQDQPSIFEDSWGPPGTEPRCFLCTCTPVRREDGNVDGVLVIAEDITERKKAAQELVKQRESLATAQRLKAVGQLAGGIAHDFNNLLTVIQGHIEVALDEIEEGEPLETELTAIEEAAERAADLTSQLLAFSKRQALTVEAVSLNDVIDGVEPMLRRLIGEDICIRKELSARMGPVRGDRRQLEQVLVNLAVNARDAMPQGGTLEFATCEVDLDGATSAQLGLAAPGAFCLLTVTDTGVGMDEETRRRAFEPFFTTKGPGEGTGLGLASVYGVITQSGGAVVVSSQPGQGTTFSIYLARVDGEPAEREKLPDQESQGHETVLVVEDERAVLAIAQRMLQRAGFRVLGTTSPREALKLFDENPEIDLLLTDLVMPELDGAELAAQLTARRPELRVLFMSGYSADVLARREVGKLGAPLIDKPFTRAQLTSAARSILDS